MSAIFYPDGGIKGKVKGFTKKGDQDIFFFLDSVCAVLDYI